MEQAMHVFCSISNNRFSQRGLMSTNIKQFLPASSRSFHEKTDRLIADSEAIQSTLNQVGAQQQLQIALLRSLASKPYVGKSFYLIGEPGYPNFGDELIAAAWLRYLAARHPEIPVYLDCARPGPAAAILRNAHPNLRVVDTISRLTIELLDGAKAELASISSEDSAPSLARIIGSRIEAALSNEGTAARYASGLRILNYEVRSVHYIGGGYMNGMWQHNLARLSAGATLARRGIPVFATGLGITPLSGDAIDYARGCLSAFSLVTVRDASSLSALNGMSNVQLATDDCFVNGLSTCVNPTENAPDYMVCIQGDLVDNCENLHSHVISQLEKWGVDKTKPIGVVECNPYVDYAIFEQLSEAGYSPVLYPAIDLIERGLPVKQNQTWLSTRYHPHLIASAFGCSGSYIPLGNKFYEDKHRAVLQMGSHWTPSNIGAPSTQPGPGFKRSSAPEEYEMAIQESVSRFY